jgi:uncharacterized protein YjdB
MRSRFDSNRFDTSLVGLQWALRFVLLAMALLSLAACSDDPTSNGRPIAFVQVTAAEPTVELGDSVLLSAAPKEADGTVRTDLTVSWFSTDTSVARVEGRAGQKGMVVGKKAGTVTIRAMAGSKTGETALEVTVTGPAAPAIHTIEPATATEGDPLLTITVTGANFSEMSLVRWNGVAVATEFVSSTVLRALITPAALAQAGTAEVAVRTGPPGGGTSAGKPFTILSRVAAVNVRVTQPVLWVGEELQVEATPQDQGGNDLPKRATTWTTSDPTVLAVNNQGVVRPLREGYAEVVATVDGKVGSEGVYVKTAPGYDLMYDSNRGGNRELWIISLGVDEAPRRWLAEGFWGEDANTKHDGTKIVFVSRDQFLNSDIWVANRDGSGLTRLTTYAGADDQPVWTLDGRIVFRSMRSGQSQIWIMNADGSGQRNLMDDSYNMLGGQQSHPTVSPDNKLFFQISYPDYDRTVLATMPLNGTWRDLRELTPMGFSDSDPAISWAGHMLLVHRKQGAIDYGLVYLDVNGNQLISTSYPGPGFMPAWSRNDKWLAYSSSPNGTNPTDIYVAQPHDFWRKRITIGEAQGGGRNPVFIKR